VAILSVPQDESKQEQYMVSMNHLRNEGFVSEDHIGEARIHKTYHIKHTIP
jgi:hypothetical protein